MHKLAASWVMRNCRTSMINANEILLYTTKDGEVKIDVLYGDQNIWLTQKKMALLFGVQIPAINKHLKNIFESGELIEESVISIGIGFCWPVFSSI